MARRVNIKFLYILTAGLLGLVLVAFLAPRFIKAGSRDTAKLVKEGDEAMARDDWEVARDKYVQALGGDPNNTDLLVKVGDVLIKLTPTDPSLLQIAHQQWNRAVSIDPGHTAALNRLLDSYWDELELLPRADLFERSRLLADKLLAVDPKDGRALRRKHVATIRQWLSTDTTPSQQVEASIAQLTEMMKADPATADLPFFYGQAMARQGRLLVEQGSRDLGYRKYDEASATMERARAAQPDNASMQYYAYQLFSHLRATDQRTREARATDKRYDKPISESIAAAQRAAASLKGDALLYDRIQEAAALRAAQDGDNDRAKAIITEYYKAQPDNQQARLLYARLLGQDAATREEAVGILSKDMVARADLSGARAAIYLRLLQAQTYNTLVLTRIADLQTTPKDEAEKRKRYFEQAEETLDKLRRIESSRSPRVLALEGRMHLLRGEDVQAVKALEAAYEQMPAVQQDNELMYWLAKACIQTRQPGRAKEMLQQVVTNVSTAVAPRVELAHLLIQENDLARARAHVDALDKVSPDSPEVKRLKLLLTIGGNDPAAALDAARKLPEANVADRFRKAQVMGAIDRLDEAEGLLRVNLGEDPKHLDSTRTLVALLMKRDHKPQAEEVVRAGLQHHPDDPWLKEALRQATGAAARTPAQVRDDIEAIKDPFERSIGLYRHEMRYGTPEAAVKHLEAAHAAKPEDVQALDMLFQHHCALRRFDRAQPYLERLVQLNADKCGGKLYRQRFAVLKGDQAGAEALAGELTREYAEFAASWLALAQAQQARGKFDEAIKSYAEVRKRQQNHYDALRSLVDCYYQTNRLEEAKATLRDARAAFPNDLTFREMFLNHQVNYEDPASALPEREQLLKKNPDDPAYHLALAATYFHAAQREATAAGKRELSAQHLRQAYQTLTGARDRFPDDGRFYAQAAEMLQYDNKLPEAEALLKQFAARPSVRERPEPHLILADFYGRLGRTDLARTALSDALAKDPRDLGIRLRLAAILTQLKQFDEAGVVLDGIASADRDHPSVFRQGVEIAIAKGDLAKAEADLRGMLKRRDTADLRNLLASILIDTQRTPEALEHVRQALALDARNDATRYLLALALAKSNPPDVDGAVNELVGLRDRSPRNMQVRLLLAELWARTGKQDGATRELEDALAKAPLNRDVRLALVRLYRQGTPPKYDDALRHVDAAARDPVFKNDPTWPREAAITYMAKKEPQRAIMLMHRAIDLDADNVEYRRELVDMLLQFEDYAGVMIETDKLLKKGTETWWLRHQRGLAIAKTREPGKTDDQRNREAVAEFDKALALADAAKDPAVAEFVLRGLSGVVVGEKLDGVRRVSDPVGFDEAIARIKPRLANDADQRWALLQTQMLRGKGDFEGAARAVEQMMAASKAHPDRRVRAAVLRAAADIYQNTPTRKLDQARRAYAELLDLAPDDLVSLNNLAYLLAVPPDGSPPQPQKAKEYSGRAFEQVRFGHPSYEMIADTHGWILTLCGGADAVDGLNLLQKVVLHADEFLEARYHLGEAHLRMSPPQREPARQVLARAMEVIKKREDAKKPVDAELKDKIQGALVRAQGLSSQK